MLDVAPAAAPGDGEDNAELAVFVDRLAAAGSDRPTALAHDQIRRTIAAGSAPPGLRRLAEALAASVSDRPPSPRRPSEDAGSVVGAMRTDTLVVLEEFDAPAVAGVVAALLADGRRVVVTAATPGELATVREQLPADVVDRVLDRLPGLPVRDVCELRRLLATSTPARRARTGQQLPPAAALPAPADVAMLCRHSMAERPTERCATAEMIPSLLADLADDRRAAVTSVAHCVSRSLGALHPRAEREWAWSLLSNLIYSRHRPTFDRMLEDTAQALAALDRARQVPPVTVGGPLPDGAVSVLLRYGEFLDDGGRSRTYFRSQTQRDVQPVLDLVRVGGKEPDTEDEVTAVIEHLRLGKRLGRIDAGCAEIGIPAPCDEAELVQLTEGLIKVGGAARSVGALRHDVLFIAPNSPLSVPDVDTAEQVAGAILHYAEHGSAAQAGYRLDRMADELASRSPATAAAPEHELAVGALRGRDATAYAAAVDALEAARRDLHDENQLAALLRRLAANAPRLAASWEALGESDPAALGLACFVSSGALLSALPPTDTADVVLVVGAARLGVERLLLTAVAPRMIAAVAPGERPDGAPTLLSVLRRAAAMVIRGRSAGSGRVVRIADAARPAGVPGPAPVGQAGA